MRGGARRCKFYRPTAKSEFSASAAAAREVFTTVYRLASELSGPPDLIFPTAISGLLRLWNDT
jgi:hypothetical protein